MIRLLASVSVAALLLAACAPRAEGPGDTPEAEEVIAGTESAQMPVEAGDVQLNYSLESDSASLASEIDPAILAFDPVLAHSLWMDAKSALDSMAAQAADDKISADQYAAETGEESWFRSYSMEIRSAATLVMDDVISIEHTISQYTGGAHPNYFMGGEIYRKGDAEPVKVAEIIADEAGFRSLVVKGLVAEKIARGWSEGARADLESEMSDLLSPGANSAEVFEGHLVLTGSTEAGKAGGITVLFSPYEVGPYAEGAYDVALTAADLAPLLTPAWKDRFGGAPL